MDLTRCLFCAPAAAAALPDPQPLGMRIPRMAASADGQRPNFIVILTGGTSVAASRKHCSSNTSGHGVLRIYCPCQLIHGRHQVLSRCC
jgi:hypothetical protein